MKSRKYYFILILFVFIFTSRAFAGDFDKGTSSTVGTEFDIFPYITGGYDASIWLGYNKWRFRGVVTEVYPPDFAVPGDFKEWRLRASAFMVDYFFHKNLEGVWVGSGIELWNSRVENDDGTNGSFDNTILTIGSGYVRKLYGNLYLNLWGGGHLRIGGTPEKEIGSAIFELPAVMQEISLKLGWHF